MAQLPDVGTFLTAFAIGALKKPGKDWLALSKKLSGHLVNLAKVFKLEALEEFDGGLPLLCGISRYSKRVSLQLFEMALSSMKGLPYCDASQDDLDTLRLDLLTVGGLLEDAVLQTRAYLRKESRRITSAKQQERFSEKEENMEETMEWKKDLIAKCHDMVCNVWTETSNTKGN